MALRIRPGREYSQKEFFQILTEIDNRLTDLERALNAGNYVITNLGEERLRDLDINQTSFEDLKKLVGTLIEDMKAVGRLK